tara:strand:+ start:165 stop:365 length:201 start_codon:yes stop_codon:yes gene_type:complete
MSTLEERPQYWDLGWCVLQAEATNWVITFNGRPIEKEFASKRDAQDKMYVLEQEMNSYVTGEALVV